MNFLQEINNWSSSHNPKWLVFLRVLLGICLFAKGISFLNNILSLQMMIESSSLNDIANSLWLALVITWINILGGTFIILGLFTRISILVQLPIVAGAIIFVNTKNSVFAGQSDLLFTLFVLALLILFIIEGGGKISLDNYVKKHLL